MKTFVAAIVLGFCMSLASTPVFAKSTRSNSVDTSCKTDQDCTLVVSTECEYDRTCACASTPVNKKWKPACTQGVKTTSSECVGTQIEGCSVCDMCVPPKVRCQLGTCTAQ